MPASLKTTVCLWIVYCTLPLIVLSQQQAGTVTTTHQPSDTFFLAKKKGLLGKIGKSIAIHNEPENFTPAANNLLPYCQYKGKIIHRIWIQPISFATSISDTANNNTNTFIADIGNALHTNTKKRIIRNNLFVREQDAFSPIDLADNDRYLRQLPYLQDAQILVKPYALDTNFVDVIVVYKDVFPYSAAGSANTTNAFLEIKNDNFLGLGDQLTIQNYVDLERQSKHSMGFNYTKRNFAGSFFNFSLGAATLGNAYTNGKREETNWYIKAELPLVSPYSMWTGEAEYSHRFTNNQYHFDSLYNQLYSYNLRLLDTWIGYNISCKQLFNETQYRKAKHFVAIRTAVKQFSLLPTAYQKIFNPAFSNHTFALASYTIFKQNHFKTNYIYGFGRYEDLPEGFHFSVVGGYSQQSANNRWYAASEFQKSVVNSHGKYFNYTIKLGGYVHRQTVEDASVLVGFESISKLKHLGSSKWHVRHFLSGSAAQIFNASNTDLLRLNSQFGLPRFAGNDSMKACGRYTINCENVLFNTWTWLGFKFAPFIFTNFTYLHNYTQSFTKGDFYSALGGGVRSRNENLVFGTIELKAMYFPRTTLAMPAWKISLISGLRFRYNSQYIKKPDFIQLN
jgi:hypothetical protein